MKRIDGKKRGRMTGRYEGGKRYARIPLEVLTSDAFKAMPDFAVRVLIAHAGAYPGHHNGAVTVTASQCKDFGIRPWKLYAGQELLELVGLLERTRRGFLKNGTKVCHWFALTWRAIDDPPEGKSYDGLTSKTAEPSDRWAKWVKPADWDKTVDAVTRKHRGAGGYERTKKKNPVTRQSGMNWGKIAPDSRVWIGPIAPDSRVRKTQAVVPDSRVTSKTLALSGDRAA